MRVGMITVASLSREQVIDVTEQIAAMVVSNTDGVCDLFVQHTTCALTVLTNEDGIAEDLLAVLHRLVPQTTRYAHDSADHVRAHVLSALVGPSLCVPIRAGKLGLGDFQRIVLSSSKGHVSAQWKLISYFAEVSGFGVAGKRTC